MTGPVTKLVPTKIKVSSTDEVSAVCVFFEEKKKRNIYLHDIYSEYSDNTAE